ncbi:hypothetical protein F5Y16DRAFT_374615 [Xylariaceae sp. FL0255]|nr:hypothetical protein F5Y16DRAFT_374615 [Xylariaceae sp. FL0255]
MTLFQKLLHLTNYRSPFLRTAVPCAAAAFALQAAVALPSIPAQSDRFYDASGSATFLAVTLLSLYLPSLRARAAAAAAGLPKPAFPSLLQGLKGLGAGEGAGAAGGAGKLGLGLALNWRQVALSAAVGFWAFRLGTYLFDRILKAGHDSRFDKIRKSPPQFAGAFFGQATWVTLCLMPVIAVNSVPAAVFTAAAAKATVPEVLGWALFFGGLGFEMVADRQKGKWLDEKRKKIHDEQFMTTGLWTVSQYPNYFGEVTLWTGIATAAASTLLTNPVQAGLGFSGGVFSKLATLGLCYVSPSIVAFLLLKVTGVPLSEKKYDKRYGDRKDYQEWKKNTPKFFPKLF